MHKSHELPSHQGDGEDPQAIDVFDAIDDAERLAAALQKAAGYWLPTDARRAADAALQGHMRLTGTLPGKENDGVCDGATIATAFDPSRLEPPALLSSLTLDAGRAYHENSRLLGAVKAREMHDASLRNIRAVELLVRHAVAAESFISGFEGDELQEGIDDLLNGLRNALLLQAVNAS